jgi:hypothetical protein
MINGDAGWLGWCSTIDRGLAAAVAAREAGATGVAVHRGETQSVVRSTGDDAVGKAFVECCDVALYRTITRHVLRHVRTWPVDTSTPGVTMLFSIHRRPGMDVADFHQWWEQSHAPIALRHHVGMWDYAQVSVVDTVHGEAWDGFAVTQWPTLDDLMHRFSSGPEGTEALRHDAAQFTDPTTLRRHLLDEVVTVEQPWPSQVRLPVGMARSVELPEGTEVVAGEMPDGLSAEVRLTPGGRPRLDVLWRTDTTADSLDGLSVRFDDVWRRLAEQIGFDAQASSNS